MVILIYTVCLKIWWSTTDVNLTSDRFCFPLQAGLGSSSTSCLWNTWVINHCWQRHHHCWRWIYLYNYTYIYIYISMKYSNQWCSKHLPASQMLKEPGCIVGNRLSSSSCLLFIWVGTREWKIWQVHQQAKKRSQENKLGRFFIWYHIDHLISSKHGFPFENRWP